MHLKHFTNKVAIVPYVMRDAVRHFLIHLPKAKNPAEQDDMMWGIVRGTVRDIKGNDLRDVDILRATPPAQIEEVWQTALHEAEEECGIHAQDIIESSVVDHGLMDYGSLTRAPYPLRVFSAEIIELDAEILILRASDAQALTFATLTEIKDKSAQKNFKPGYIPIIEQLHRQLGNPTS